MIGSSRHLEESYPSFAFAVYPLNVEALLAQAAAALRQEGDELPLEEMERRVAGAIPLNAGDARLYSILGEILDRHGNRDAAGAMFDHALSLAKTELYALRWSIRRAVEAEDYQQAVERLDALFRRWPQQIGPVAPAVAAIFSAPAAHSVLLDRIAASPPWRKTLLAVLSSDTAENPGFAAQLLQDLAAGAGPPTAAETSQLLASLFRRREYDLAYRTFLFTLSAQEKDLSGFIFNGEFRQGPSARTFDWSIRQQPGVTISLPAKTGDGSRGAGLSVEFSGTPVRSVGVQQYLLLPPGQYRLEVEASAIAAMLPKSLLWSIDCVSPSQPMLRADIPGGNYQTQLLSYKFSSSEQCAAQILTLRTNAVAESWSNRYGGSVLFHRIRILREES